MDIQLLGKESIKLKTKHAVLLIDPTAAIPKTEADAILILDESLVSEQKIEGFRVFIKGPGEYEVSNVKISGIPSNGSPIYILDADNIKVLFGKVSSLERVADKITETHLAVLDADTADDSIIPKIEPRVLLLYGKEKNELLKKLGKEGSPQISKYSTTFEKLPAELEIASLG